MFFIPGAIVLVVLHLTSGSGINRQTAMGEVIGAEYRLADGTIIYHFLGIPYAYPPIDARLRFAEPRPLDHPFETPWAASYNLQCLQILSDLSVIGEEDCLYLNVYTPASDDRDNFDVLVLIHGGEFKYGYSEDQIPDYLFATIKNVVFVSINYRLGPLGFLSTEDEVVPGNNGLKDQVVALKWVQENIRNFGGNPDRVTLAGVGAGAVSVHLHYLSPLSQGLFAQGISLSGGALSPLVRTKNIRKDAENLASIVDCRRETSVAMYECLRQKDGKTILTRLAVGGAIYTQQYQFYPHFGPVVEQAGSTRFLDAHPFTILQAGQIKNAPWLVSILKAENYVPPVFFTNRLQELNDNWNGIAPDLLRFKDQAPPERISEISEKIKEEYFKNQAITRDNVNKLSNLIADRLYLTNMEDAIRLHAAASTAPVYLYVFDYAGSNTASKTPTEVDKNAMDDYVNILKVAGANNDENMDMIKTMVNVWKGFIQKGVPEAPGRINWPVIQRDRVTGGDLSYVNIAGPSDVKVISSSGLSDRYFWNTLSLDEPHVTSLRKVRERQAGFVSNYIVGPVESIVSIFLKALRFIFISPIEALFGMSSGGSSKP